MVTNGLAGRQVTGVRLVSVGRPPSESRMGLRWCRMGPGMQKQETDAGCPSRCFSGSQAGSLGKS